MFYRKILFLNYIHTLLGMVLTFQKRKEDKNEKPKGEMEEALCLCHLTMKLIWRSCHKGRSPCPMDRGTGHITHYLFFKSQGE